MEKRISLGPNQRQSISILERSQLNEDSLLQRSNRRSSFAMPINRSSIRQSLVPKPKTLSTEEIKKMYTECYLLCDQRKVNEKNVWSINYIDYMKDVVQVESAENKGTSVFAQAGLAIDTGVQIYSVRVDHVHKTTFAVVDSIKQAEINEENELSSFDETNEHVEEEIEEKKTKVTKRKKNLTKNTIEKNPKNLLSNPKKSEYHKDRLFHQRVSDLEGKSILQDVVHNYGDFLSGDYAEYVEIDKEEEGEFEDPIIEFDIGDISMLQLNEINTQQRNVLVDSIVDDLKTPFATQNDVLQMERDVEKMVDELPDVEMHYMDDANPINDDGEELLPNTNDYNNGFNFDLLAPIVSRQGFTYFDPNMYSIKDIQKQLKVDMKEGKFLKQQKTKKERSKKDTLKTFDLSEEKDIAQNKIFNKQKRTTKKLQIYEMTKSNFFSIDISQFSQLNLVPSKRLDNDDLNNNYLNENRRDSIIQPRMSLVNPRQTLAPQNKEEKEEEENMFMPSDDEDENTNKNAKEEDKNANENKTGYFQVAAPRMISIEKITAATKPKNLDYDGSEKIIMNVLKKWIEDGKGEIIDFQSVLDGIMEIVDDKRKEDLTVHFIFVSLNIMCFKRKFRLIKENDSLFLDLSDGDLS